MKCSQKRKIEITSNKNSYRIINKPIIQCKPYDKESYQIGKRTKHSWPILVILNNS